MTLRSRYHRLMYRLWCWRQNYFGFWSPETLLWAEQNDVGRLVAERDPFPCYEPGLDRAFSAGVETDIVQALRNIAADVDPIDPVRAEQIRARVVDAADELGQRRRDRTPDFDVLSEF